MTTTLLSREALERALHLRDLTNPLQGPHAIQLIVEKIHEALADGWNCDRYLHRGSPLVSIEDNYDRLGYPPDGAARDARYSRYVTSHILLRTHMSAEIPGLLRAMALDPPRDILLICPGLVYRRDVIDRLHTGEPHQLDLWRIAQRPLGVRDLRDMIDRVIKSVLPDHRYRITHTRHPYTNEGIEIEVEANGKWVEVGECGLAAKAMIDDAGLDSRQVSGLAMGLGLDRLLMIRKNIVDIRLLRSNDTRVVEQMLDLEPYRPVSDQPAIRRDLSIAVRANLMPEELGDTIRVALDDRSDLLEAVEILEETLYEELPESARQRMGMKTGQKNILLRLVIRDPIETLTRAEANEIRNQVYCLVHEGDTAELAVNAR